MSRKPRLHICGCLYHVISRGNDRQTIFREDEDYEMFLKILERVKKRIPFRLYGYCLMPNHFHLLIEAGETPVAVIMQRLLTSYTVYYNRAYKHKGHLFQGRYKSVICDKDSYLLELSRYIHLNPVRAGLSRTPSAWKWSGYGEYIGKQEKWLITVEPVLAQFGERLGDAVRRYVEFVHDGMRMRSKSEYYPREKAPYIGSDQFIEDITVRHLELMNEHSPSVKSKTESLADMLSTQCKETGVNAAAICGSSRRGEGQA